MIKVRNVLLRNTGILLKDKKSLEDFREQLGALLEIGASQITFTHDEISGFLDEDDPCLRTIKKLQEEPAETTGQ